MAIFFASSSINYAKLVFFYHALPVMFRQILLVWTWVYWSRTIDLNSRGEAGEGQPDTGGQVNRAAMQVRRTLEQKSLPVLAVCSFLTSLSLNRPTGPIQPLSCDVRLSVCLCLFLCFIKHLITPIHKGRKYNRSIAKRFLREKLGRSLVSDFAILA